MNVQAFDKLISDVSKCDPDKFSMNCHRTCMMSFLPSDSDMVCTRDAATILDISQDDCKDLFLNYPSTGTGKYHEITPSDAVKVLLHYNDTGVVDWSIIL